MELLLNFNLFFELIYKSIPAILKAATKLNCRD
jgi:hypothetical protein